MLRREQGWHALWRALLFVVECVAWHKSDLIVSHGDDVHSYECPHHRKVTVLA